MPWQGEATIFDRPPLNPLPLGGEEVSAVQRLIPLREGKKYRLSNDLFPLPTGGGEGVGDPIQTPPSVPTPISCTRGV